jgi:curved DNA-binding protein
MEISLEDADRGGKKSLSLQSSEVDARGRMRPRTRTYEVRIPPGITNGARIRLAGQGGPGGERAGDLYLRVHLQPHETFKVNGHDLEVNVRVTPWKAALGGKVTVPTLSGHASLNMPAGTQSGQRLRLRGKGLGGKGDLYAAIQIVVPRRPTAKEKELFEQLARVSSFDPDA